MSQRSLGMLIMALSGLLVWSAHFGLLYGLQTAFCTVAPAGWSVRELRIAGLVLTAVAVMAVLVLARYPRLGTSPGADIAGADNMRFLRQTSMAASILALLAMLWTILPLLLLPACGPAAA